MSISHLQTYTEVSHRFTSPATHQSTEAPPRVRSCGKSGGSLAHEDRQIKPIHVSGPAFVPSPAHAREGRSIAELTPKEVHAERQRRLRRVEASVPLAFRRSLQGR